MKINDNAPHEKGWHLVVRDGTKMRSIRWCSNGFIRPTTKNISVDHPEKIETWWFEDGVWTEERPWKWFWVWKKRKGKR